MEVWREKMGLGGGSVHAFIRRLRRGREWDGGEGGEGWGVGEDLQIAASVFGFGFDCTAGRVTKFCYSDRVGLES